MSMALCYKQIHGHFSVIFHTTFLAMKNVRNLQKKLALFYSCTDKSPFVRRVDRDYGHLSTHFSFITQKWIYDCEWSVNNTGPCRSLCYKNWFKGQFPLLCYKHAVNGQFSVVTESEVQTNESHILANVSVGYRYFRNIVF